MDGVAINNLGCVVGTITGFHNHFSSGKKDYQVLFDDGQRKDLYEENLQKYEEKTELKLKEPETSEYQNHLLAIYENTMFTDFTIICKAEEEEYKFPCHKAVLASGSTSGHFARMFGSGMTESSSGEVVVEGYDKEEVEHFIKFLYVLKMEKEVIISATYSIFELSCLAINDSTGSRETLGEVLEDG